MDFTIRLATTADAEALVAIYQYYVEKTPITFEYEVPTVEDFQERIRSTLERYPFLVAEKDGQILGYAYAGSYKGRVAYDWTVEVSVYVAIDTHAKGLGSALYQALEEALSQQHVVNLAACITAGNMQSEQFHEKLGYQKVAYFKHFGYKFEKWHDIVWMQKELGGVPKKPQPFIPFSQLSHN